jgi:hypothetical protein
MNQTFLNVLNRAYSNQEILYIVLSYTRVLVNTPQPFWHKYFLHKILGYFMIKFVNKEHLNFFQC